MTWPVSPRALRSVWEDTAAGCEPLEPAAPASLKRRACVAGPAAPWEGQEPEPPSSASPSTQTLGLVVQGASGVWRRSPRAGPPCPPMRPCTSSLVHRERCTGGGSAEEAEVSDQPEAARQESSERPSLPGPSDRAQRGEGGDGYGFLKGHWAASLLLRVRAWAECGEQNLAGAVALRAASGGVTSASHCYPGLGPGGRTQPGVVELGWSPFQPLLSCVRTRFQGTVPRSREDCLSLPSACSF